MLPSLLPRYCKVLYREKTRAEEQEETTYIKSLPFYTFDGDVVVVNTLEHADELCTGWLEELDTIALSPARRGAPNSKLSSNASSSSSSSSAASAASAASTASSSTASSASSAATNPSALLLISSSGSAAVAGASRHAGSVSGGAALAAATKKEQEAKHLVSTPAYGFDIEWPVEYVKNAKQLPTALLQIAHPNGKCYLFHLSKYSAETKHNSSSSSGGGCGGSGGGSTAAAVSTTAASAFPDKLRQLIGRQDCLKVGVGIAGDVMKLERDFDMIEGKGIVDLSVLANQVLESNQRWSLSGLVNQTLMRRLPKPGNTRISNWSCPILSVDQVKYAASDAAVSLAVHNALIARLPLF